MTKRPLLLGGYWGGIAVWDCLQLQSLVGLWSTTRRVTAAKEPTGPWSSPAGRVSTGQRLIEQPRFCLQCLDSICLPNSHPSWTPDCSVSICLINCLFLVISHFLTLVMDCSAPILTISTNYCSMPPHLVSAMHPAQGQHHAASRSRDAISPASNPAPDLAGKVVLPRLSLSAMVM